MKEKMVRKLYILIINLLKRIVDVVVVVFLSFTSCVRLRGDFSIFDPTLNPKKKHLKLDLQIVIVAINYVCFCFTYRWRW